WTAAHGDVAAGGVALFAILFVWQLPHALAIAMLYKDDYARGGFRLLPVVDESGSATGRQILAHCLVLLPLSLVPTMLDVTGVVYFCGAVVLGLGLTAFAVPILVDASAREAPAAGPAGRVQHGRHRPVEPGLAPGGSGAALARRARTPTLAGRRRRPRGPVPRASGGPVDAARPGRPVVHRHDVRDDL